MMNGFAPGETCVVTHDIGTAFRRGEQVVVEEVSPDTQRPEYRYVVFSRTDAKRFRLSDRDLAPMQPAAPPEVAVTQTVAGPPARGGGGTGKIVAAVLITLLVIAAVFGVLYLVLWRDSGTEQPTTQPSTPATRPQTQPRTQPTTPSKKYGTVSVTQAAYDDVSSGMSYDQVEGVFGGPGVKQSETGSPGTPGYEVRYAWDGKEPLSAVFCTFEDDKLTQKSNQM